ncbi:MAG: helix-turn-helix transcriptional regulator [Candidatus Thermoplasmatota archaeon]|jgi:DNA-binding HxlR family transcriptional regulator|nr:helix-turn-helix transcriptional regulator [Candidatus Thermoplasmatota archaeon]MCL5793766.1 helix-turn-helix transcriptional regulator [Candidatus Thermoplasmatota archaeon]
MVTGRKAGEILEVDIARKGKCPIVESIKEIGGEWRMIVVRYLSEGPMGFNEILRRANGINSKTLSSTLKYLESRDIIIREIESTRPFRVKYSLTRKGTSLGTALHDLQDWGNEWLMGKDSGPRPA